MGCSFVNALMRCEQALLVGIPTIIHGKWYAHSKEMTKMEKWNSTKAGDI